jgi:hypothetical protein
MLSATVAHTMLVEQWVTDDDMVGAGDAACHHCIVHGGKPLAGVHSQAARRPGSVQEVCASYSDCS